MFDWLPLRNVHAVLSALQTRLGFMREPRTGSRRLLTACAAAFCSLGLAAQALAATADIDGDGRPDTVVILSNGPGAPQTLQVTLATGRVLTAPAGDGLPPAMIVRIRRVAGRRGAEIFVDTAHISTMDTITIFDYRQRRLEVAGELFAYGGDYDIRFGFDCMRRGAQHLIVQHAFTLNGTRWSRKDTIYVWRNGLLKRRGPSTTRSISGAPARGQTSVGC